MAFKGQKEFNKYNVGQKLSVKQAILAKCFECMGNYVDGKADCEIQECPLYSFMPYGKAWKGRKKKIVSQRTLKALRQGQKRV